MPGISMRISYILFEDFAKLKKIFPFFSRSDIDEIIPEIIALCHFRECGGFSTKSVKIILYSDTLALFNV